MSQSQDRFSMIIATDVFSVDEMNLFSSASNAPASREGSQGVSTESTEQSLVTSNSACRSVAPTKQPSPLLTRAFDVCACVSVPRSCWLQVSPSHIMFHSKSRPLPKDVFPANDTSWSGGTNSSTSHQSSTAGSLEAPEEKECVGNP